MNKSCSVDIFNTCEHLQQNITSNHLCKLFPNIFFEVSNITAFQIHHEKVLTLLILSINKLGNLQHSLHSLEFFQKLILLNQNSFSLIGFFHFNRNLFIFFYIICFVNSAKTPRSKLWPDLEPLHLSIVIFFSEWALRCLSSLNVLLCKLPLLVKFRFSFLTLSLGFWRHLLGCRRSTLRRSIIHVFLRNYWSLGQWV